MFRGSPMVATRLAVHGLIGKGPLVQRVGGCISRSFCASSGFWQALVTTIAGQSHLVLAEMSVALIPCIAPGRLASICIDWRTSEALFSCIPKGVTPFNAGMLGCRGAQALLCS
jgi:hypothetical protein